MQSESDKTKESLKFVLEELKNKLDKNELKKLKQMAQKLPTLEQFKVMQTTQDTRLNEFQIKIAEHNSQIKT